MKIIGINILDLTSNLLSYVLYSILTSHACFIDKISAGLSIYKSSECSENYQKDVLIKIKDIWVVLS